MKLTATVAASVVVLAAMLVAVLQVSEIPAEASQTVPCRVAVAPVSGLTYSMEPGQEHMAEDQSPLRGFLGGELVTFDGYDGTAHYSDGSSTDGRVWRLDCGLGRTEA